MTIPNVMSLSPCVSVVFQVSWSYSQNLLLLLLLLGLLFVVLPPGVCCELSA